MNFIHPRFLSYCITAIVLIFVSVPLRDLSWRGSTDLHTIMEVVAALLALAVGGLALLRYHSLKHVTFLFVGMGFFGTALLDAYHATVTSQFFAAHFSSSLDSLIPWSWLASRVFLSQFLCLSYLAWRREQRAGEGDSRFLNEKIIYAAAAAMTMVFFVFLSFVPLLPAYYDFFFFHRPAEFVPALFFLAALAGYLHKGQWRTNQIEHWLVLALVVSVVSQIAFMPLSEQLFDPMFDAAHLLKKTSYVLVLVGLVISIYQLHKNEVEHALQLQRANEGLQSEARLRQAESAVRELIANMTSPEDLGVVLDGLRLQLQRLGVEHDSLSLQIFNEDGDDFVSIFSDKKHGIALDKLINRAWPQASDNVEKYPWVAEVWKTNKTHHQPRVTDGESWAQGISILDVPFSQGTLAVNRRDCSGFSPDEIATLEKMAIVLSEGFSRFSDLVQRGQMRRQLEQVMLDAHCIVWEAEVTLGPDGTLLWDTRVLNEETAQSFFPLDVSDSVKYALAWHLSRPEEERQAIDAKSSHAIHSGETRYNQQSICMDRDGQPHWFVEDAHIQALDGGYWKVTGVANEVTETHQAEERFSAAIRHIVDAFIIIDDRCIVQVCNPATERIFGYSAGEVIGQNVSLLMPEPFHSEHDGYVGRYMVTGVKTIIGTSREVEGRRRDGSFFPVRLSVGEFVVGGRRMFTGTMQDISERKRGDAEQMALHHMRERVWNMETSGDIDEVLRAVWESIEIMGIDFDNCGVNIAEDIEDRDTAFLTYILSRDGEVAQTGRLEGIEPLTSVWRQKKPAYRPDLNKDDPHGEFAVVKQYYADICCVLDVSFERGTLAINNHRPHAFSEADIRSLEQLAQVLDEAFLRIGDIRAREQYYIDLEREIADRQRAQEELNIALLEAEEANHAKSQFLANMSHEIRTPMNAVIGMTELAMDTRLDDTQREYLDIVKNSAYSLLQVIDDILDFSKIEAGKMTIEGTGFALRQCVDSIGKTLALRAHGQGVELVCQVEVGVPDRLVGDPLRLRQILVNLLSNAVKFTEEGEIELRVALHEQEDEGVFLHFSVRDTGIGIPKEKQQRVFESFTQADASTTRRFGGTGLGLAICYQLVQLMGGRMWLESESGRGSTFHFTARFALASGPAEVAEVELPPHALEQRVLIVDDNATKRRILMEYLRGWNMQAEAVASGQEALISLGEAASKATPFSIVLLDIMMPEMDGFEVAERIAENPELHPTLIVLSSADGPETKERCQELGIDISLRKPISQSDLFDVLLRVEGVSPVQRAQTPELADGAPSLHILLAEDNVFNQRVASGLLEKQGHRITVVEDGRKAVEISAREVFDVVLMDVQMPEMDGLEATQAIRQREVESGVARLPIIGLTAHAMQGDRERCIEIGMDEYVTKPIKPQELRQALASLIPGAQRASVATATAAATRIDRSAVLERCGGDEDLLRELVSIFRQDCPNYLQAMRDAIAANEAEQLSRAAHTLKGPLGTLDFIAAQQLALKIEEMGCSGELSHIDRVFAELEREILHLEPLLELLESNGGEAS
ncbi:MAG: PAS domain S-box-containing protein [Candidatus Latescibacterota bacterium]|jgi:PAS domain S-box-containing protein